MITKNLLRSSSSMLLGIMVLGAAGTANAQTPVRTDGDANPVAGLDAAGSSAEIIVTARKRDERLIDVPISLQAFSRAEIKASGIDDIQTLKDRAGFTVLSQVSTGAGGRAQGNIVFRGLQAVTFSAPTQNSGSLFIDGIFISGAPQSVNTADVERIEVLKGPQNAYFGRSTFGGAINFITRKPSDTFSAEFNGRVTARGSVDGDASIDAPIVKGLLDARVTVYDHDKVAQYHASDGGALGKEQTRGVVGTLYMTPTPDLWLKLRGTYQRDEDSAADQAYIPGRLYHDASCTNRTFPGQDAAGNQVTYKLGRPYFCERIPTLEMLGTQIIDASTIIPANLINPLEHNSLGIRFLNKTPYLDHAGLRRQIMRGSFQSGYTFASGGSLDVNVGVNRSRATYLFDIDHSSLNYFLNAFANIDQDITADVRLSSNQKKRLRGLIGASYFYSKNQQDRIDDNLVFKLPPNENLFLDARNRTPSVYGSIEFDLLPFLTATAEGRYESEMDYNYSKTGKRFQESFKNFLPRGILRFHPSPSLDIYGSYSRGAQPATLNSSFIIATPAQQAYIQTIVPGQSVFTQQAKLDSYEVGVKQALFNNRINYTLAVYQLNWNGVVTNAFITNPAGCIGISSTPACPLGINGTSVVLGNNERIRGIEFGASVRATPDIDFAFTLDYKDPKWRKYFNSTYAATFTGGIKSFAGNTVGRVPDLQATFSPSYHHALSGGWGFYARADAIYTGKAWDSDLDLVKTDDYIRVNPRIGIERKNMTLELFSTNVFNDKHWDYAALVADVTELSFSQRGVLVQPAPLREVGLRAQVKFQ